MSFSRTSVFICLLGSVGLASSSALAGNYLSECLGYYTDRATGQTVCIEDASGDEPTKCCKITDSGNIDYDDCGGVVILESGYWCVSGNDYVGVSCEVSPDGNGEVCTDHTSQYPNQYAPECDFYVITPSGDRVCADVLAGLPQGFHCCENIQNGQIDESSCSDANVDVDQSSGTTTLTCNSGTLLACAPESAVLTWCTPL